MKHFTQASSITIILIILHTDIRRFNIKCLAQCHLTKEHQTNTVSRILDSRTCAISFPEQYFASRTCGSQNISENVLCLLFLRIQLVPNNSSETVAVMQTGLFIPNYLGFISPTHSPTPGRKTWKHGYCLVWNLLCPH